MNALFEALCRASFFGLAALAVALIAQYSLGGRAPAAWRAWIWRIALLQSAFALLPLSPIRWEVLSPPEVIITAAPNADEMPVIENLPPLANQNATPIEIAPQIKSAPPIPIANAQQAPFDWRVLLLAIYALGIMFQLAQLMRGKRQLQRTLRNCTPAENPNLTARLNVLTTRLNLKTAPQLLINEGGSPFLTGVWRPQIVLPRALCEAESSQLDAILAHELAHAKRRDLVWLGLTWLVQTLLWFHPLSWLSRRFHGLETECACDELALRLAPIAPQSYGALLLNSMNHSNFSSPLAAGTCDTLFALKTRLLRLNSAPAKPRKLAKLAFVAALLLSCGALVPLKLVARAQEAPSIVPAETKQAAPTPKVVGNAVVQGVVSSQQTKKPLVGVKIVLLGSRPNKKPSDKFAPDFKTKQEVLTDARGYFRFNATGGKHYLCVEAEITTAPKSIRLSARSITFLDFKDGEKRDFKFDLDETFPKPDKNRIPTKAPKTRGTGDAVVQGLILSKQTQKPLAGVPIILLAGNARMTPKKEALADITNHQETTTDARGYFRFNAAGGSHSLLIDGRITVDAGKVSDFSAQQINVLLLREARRQNFRFELDEVAFNAPDKATTGTVLGPNGQPFAGAIVQVSIPEDAGNYSLTPVVCDSNGRFQLPISESGSALQLWADAGELTTPNSTFVAAGGEAKLQLQKDAWLNVSGRVTDETKQPLAGAAVHLDTTIGNLRNTQQSVKSDARGSFRFDHVRSGSKIFITSSLKGYGTTSYRRSQIGKDIVFAVTMPRATATLRGVILGEDGQPARNFRVEPFGSIASTRTNAQGRFLLPKIEPAMTGVRVYTPNGSNGWGPFNVRGGDQNVKIRLTKSTSYARFPRISAPAKPKTMSDKTRVR